MKKVLMLTAVVGLFAMTSCKKCGQCVGTSGSTTSGAEVCKKDVGQVAYDLTKSTCESAGGTWEE